MEQGNGFEQGILFVGNYVPPNTGRDVSDDLQRIIDENPNRSLYFPDGEYLLAKPILTPAHPERSVSLKLSDFTVLRAMEGWSHGEAMVRLGGKDAANNIYVPGSNYGIEGGIIDASGVARAISIDGGRETYIRNLSIKRTSLGIHVKYGANSGSSDADIHSVNITGNGATDSIGVLIEGYDNTFTNMRIAKVMIGVKIASAGNILRNIHPLLIRNTPAYEDFDNTVGFLDVDGTNNWYDYCYSDQFAVGFRTKRGGIFHNCFCFWYSKDEKKHVAMQSVEPFAGRVTNLTVGGAHHPDAENLLMTESALSDRYVMKNISLNGVILRDDEVTSNIFS